jgi:hypothetical protein
MIVRSSAKRIQTLLGHFYAVLFAIIVFKKYWPAYLSSVSRGGQLKTQLNLVSVHLSSLFWSVVSFFAFFSDGILMRPSIPQLQQVSFRRPPLLILIRFCFHPTATHMRRFMRGTHQKEERMEAEGRNPIYVSLEMEGVIRIVSCSGKIEGSDSHGEGLRKILYQAYHMLEKVKSVNMSTCNIFNSVVFSRQNKNRQMSRQTVSRFANAETP